MDKGAAKAERGTPAPRGVTGQSSGPSKVSPKRLFQSCLLWNGTWPSLKHSKKGWLHKNQMHAWSTSIWD